MKALLAIYWPAAVLAVFVFAITPLLLRRGKLRWEQSKSRALTWWFGIVVGLGGVGLTFASMRVAKPVVNVGRYDYSQEIVRVSALVCGVVFVIYSLLVLLPLMLDWLQGRGFVSFVSARMLGASKNGFLTVISVLSMLGVGVSSCALCSVTSIMGGFGHDLKRKILGNTAHVVIDVSQPSGYADWKRVLRSTRGALAAVGGAATPVVGGDAMASSSTNTAGVLVRGIEPGSIGKVINLKQNIEYGSFDYLLHPKKLLTLKEGEVLGRGPGGEPYYKGPSLRLNGVTPSFLPPKREYPGLILGRELAKSLHVLIGDEITLLSPMGDLSPMGIMPRARKFRVAGIFYSGMYEYDASHAYMLLPVAQALFDMKTRISKIDVRIPEPEQVTKVRPAVDAAVALLNKEMGLVEREKRLRVRDWKQMNKNLFSALKLEKVATFIILSIAIAVASFCIICTLLLMVTEKTKEIAVLKALGASDGSIMRVFMAEGVLIGTIGTLLGVAVALAACLGLSWSGVRLDPDVYYIDRLPINVDPADYAMVALAALIICTLATIYPALTASRVRPVDGLRYE
jgi:lipoprotein-releasing system permease protein